MVSVSEFTQAIQSNAVVLVDFWAEWCPHCIHLMPQVDSLTKEMAGKVAVMKVNAGEESEVASQYEVTSLPTFLIFKNGELIDRFNGSTSAFELKQKVLAATD